MTKQDTFTCRVDSEVREQDEIIGVLTVGDLPTDLYREWCDSEAPCHLYVLKDATLMARGTKAGKAYARGFFDGWKCRSRRDLAE